MAQAISVTNARITYRGAANDQPIDVEVKFSDDHEDSPNEITTQEAYEALQKLTREKLNEEMSFPIKDRLDLKGRVPIKIELTETSDDESVTKTISQGDSGWNDAFVQVLFGASTLLTTYDQYNKFLGDEKGKNLLTALSGKEEKKTVSTDKSKAPVIANDPTILKGDKLTRDELAKIPTNTAAGRFLHYVGNATELIGWHQDKESKRYDNQGTGLYELIIRDPELRKYAFGIIDEKQIDKWDKGTDLIPLPQDTEAFFFDLDETLKRNTLTGKKEGDDSIAKQFKDMRELIRIANDPSVNAPTSDKPTSGADYDAAIYSTRGVKVPTNTLSPQEINDIGDYMVKYHHWPRDKELSKNVLRMVATYITIVNIYRAARKGSDTKG